MRRTKLVRKDLPEHGKTPFYIKFDTDGFRAIALAEYDENELIWNDTALGGIVASFPAPPARQKDWKFFSRFSRLWAICSTFLLSFWLYRIWIHAVCWKLRYNPLQALRIWASTKICSFLLIELWITMNMDNFKRHCYNACFWRISAAICWQDSWKSEKHVTGCSLQLRLHWGGVGCKRRVLGIGVICLVRSLSGELSARR